MDLQRTMMETRNSIRDEFFWPTNADCVRFILQELAEVDDILMRLGFMDKDYLRAHDDVVTLDDLAMELGDLLVMCLTLCSINGVDAEEAVLLSLNKMVRRADG